MSPKNIRGFDSYTNEIITELSGMFANEDIESRPIKYNNVIIWLDAKERIHRTDGPAVERADGTVEFWIAGRKNNKDGIQ